MSSGTDRWRRLREVFDELVQMPITERPARLAQLTEGDGALRSEVESLLVAEAAAGDRFEVSPSLAPPSDR